MKAQLIVLTAALILSQSFQTNAGTQLKPATKVVATADPGTSFTFLRTHRQGKSITATWAVSAIDGVVGFSVQKTYEDPNDPYAVWEEVDIIPCDLSRSFKYTDTNVFPGTSNYRVVAVLANGNSVSSEIATVRIMSKG